MSTTSSKRQRVLLASVLIDGLRYFLFLVIACPAADAEQGFFSCAFGVLAGFGWLRFSLIIARLIFGSHYCQITKF